MKASDDQSPELRMHQLDFESLKAWALAVAETLPQERRAEFVSIINYCFQESGALDQQRTLEIINQLERLSPAEVGTLVGNTVRQLQYHPTSEGQKVARILGAVLKTAFGTTEGEVAAISPQALVQSEQRYSQFLGGVSKTGMALAALSVVWTIWNTATGIRSGVPFAGHAGISFERAMTMLGGGLALLPQIGRTPLADRLRFPRFWNSQRQLQENPGENSQALQPLAQARRVRWPQVLSYPGVFLSLIALFLIMLNFMRIMTEQNHNPGNFLPPKLK